MESGLRLPNVCESHAYFIARSGGVYYLCALGAAVVGKAFHDGQIAGWEKMPPTGPTVSTSVHHVAHAAEVLGIDYALANSIDLAHMNGCSITWIVRGLRKGKFAT